MLKTRVITAVTVFLILLAALFYFPRWGWGIFTLLIMLAACWEWGRLCTFSPRANLFFLVLSAMLCAIVFFLYVKASHALWMQRTAQALFVAAVKGNGNTSAEPRLHYGQYLMRQGRAVEAISPLASGAKQFPAHGLLRFEYGRALYQLDRLAEAETELAASGIEAAKALLAKVRRQRASGRL